MDDWNIVVRWPQQAHFSPVWNYGINEADARYEFRSRLRDPYYADASVEHQLVSDYSYHIVYEDTPRPDGTTRRRRKTIVDSWKAVPTDATGR